MATIIATPSAVNANSYATSLDAQAYHDEHGYATAWTDGDDDAKVIALIWATRLLDEQVEWHGTKSSSTQALRWPRYDAVDRDGYDIGGDVIPKFLKHATAELARHLLLKDRLQAMDENTAGLKSVTAGSVDVVFDTMDRLTLLPPSVVSLIEHYGDVARQGMSVPLIRV